MTDGTESSVEDSSVMGDGLSMFADYAMVIPDALQLIRVSRNRDDAGRFAEKASLDDVLAVLVERDEPMTGTEVGNALGISNRSALDKLDALDERGGMSSGKK